MDPEVLSRTLPGCDQLTKKDEETLEGRLQVAIGPVKGQFRGALTMTNRLPPSSYNMKLDGRGPSGFMRGEGRVELEEASGGSQLSYDIDAQVGGRIAGVGQRLLDSSAKVIAAQGLEGLERQLTARCAPIEEAPENGVDQDSPRPAPPEPPSQAALAAAVAKGVAQDLIPPRVRLALTIVVSFLAGLGVGLWWAG